MSAPLVSVIIPAFNSSDYIIESIDSALNQTYRAIEIIVIDDGSTDDTRPKLAPLIEGKKIRYHFQANRGLSAARNAGIQLAKGHYLQFLDADDLLLPQKIEKQVACLQTTSELTISGCDFRCFNGDDTGSLYGGDSFKGEFPLHYPTRLFEFDTFPARWLFPASVVKVVPGFDETMRATEDWLFLWKLLANSVAVKYLDETLALYRKHERNMTRDFERISTAHLRAIDMVDQYQKQFPAALYSQTDLDALREPYHYELGLFHARANRRAKAVRHLVKALFLSSNRRQVKLLLIAAVPAMGPDSVEWVDHADDHLWRVRAQLRKAIVG
jgi:glycosyltransferase involved in cell wall biosynthesis